MRPQQDFFDALYKEEDPFGYRSSWYEARKRQILLATLPKAHFDHGWEIGCSNGELTAALAPRCNSLLATDISPRAVQLATERNAGYPNVRVEQGAHPEDWPQQVFDLIVLSEVGYYLSAHRLEEVVSKIRGSLAPEGLLVACHWLEPFPHASLHCRQVHESIGRTLSYPLAYQYNDSDFLLQAWSSNFRSPAQIEGLK